MSSKTNIVNNEYREWVNNKHAKITNSQNKLLLPPIANEEATDQPQIQRRSLRKKDEEGTAKSSRNEAMGQSGRYRPREEPRSDTLKTLGSSASTSLREVKEEKGEVMREMKGWIKLVEAAVKGTSPLGEALLPKLESCLYKWCLFIQQTFSCYQRTQQPPLTPQPSHAKIRNPEELPPKSTLFSEATSKDHRDIYEQQIRRLSLRVQEAERELQANRANSVQSLERIAELEHLFVEWSGRVRQAAAQKMEEARARDSLLEKNESLLVELKQSLAQGKEASVAVQKIEETLRILRKTKIVAQG